MIINHNELKEKAKILLREKGFKEEEIFEEYSVILPNGSNKIIDVAGIKDNYTIGIECGSVHGNTESYESFFDEFILMPYVQKKGNQFSCSNCNHRWFARILSPKACPKCKRYFTLSKSKEII